MVYFVCHRIIAGRNSYGNEPVCMEFPLEAEIEMEL
jgi:hypothetical protein